LIKVKAGGKVTEVSNIEHKNNGRSDFVFTPEESLETSDGFVNYFLKVKKSEDGEYLEFKLPEADKAALFNIDLVGHLTLKMEESPNQILRVMIMGKPESMAEE
jgi:hypothetical protein